MTNVLISGNPATYSLPVASGAAAVTLGLFVDITSDGAGYQITGTNSSTVAGIAYGGDYKGKYTSGSSGTGIGSAVTQAQVSSGNYLTVITLGCGAVVSAIAGEANLNAGVPVKVDSNGYVVAMVPASTDSTAGSVRKVGRTVTQQTTSGSAVSVLLG